MADAMCSVCGAVFALRPKGERRNRYCGKECALVAAAARRGGGRGEVPCGICGTLCRRRGTTACCSDECRRERERRRGARRYAEDPGRIYRVYKHQWRVYNARRQLRIEVQTIPGACTEAKIEARMAYWGRRCWMCGSTELIERDHVKPLSKGGQHLPANIRPACRPCNRSKKDTWPIPLCPGPHSSIV
jgi:5-methylcytosine-specific restriction endonuclease McrA